MIDRISERIYLLKKKFLLKFNTQDTKFTTPPFRKLKFNFDLIFFPVLFHIEYNDQNKRNEEKKKCNFNLKFMWLKNDLYFILFLAQKK